MVPEQKISEFVIRLRDAAGANLQSVVLYGSAAASDFVPAHSDVNLLCVLGETSFAAILALAPAVQWWAKQKHRSPLLMTAEELRGGADVFSIEFLDMQQRHRVLWGDDVLKTLHIPMHLHRAQLEYELREKTILLRQQLLMTGDDAARWELLLRSLPAFATLFRHALLAMNQPPAATKREAGQRLAGKLGLDPAAFLQLLDIREGKVDKKSANVAALFAGYLNCVEQVTAAVDRMLDSSAPQKT